MVTAGDHGGPGFVDAVRLLRVTLDGSGGGPDQRVGLQGQTLSAQDL